MMRSLYSAVSGLKSHQTKMDAVGHNIANVNTYGYKTQRVTFADTLYQTSSGASAPTGNRGGVNAKQIGLGVGVASVDTIFTDSSKQSTGKNTDVALMGEGLFIVKDNSGVYYTRDGSFSFDADGNYVTSGGQFVQGWMATDGKLATTGDTGKITIQQGKAMQSAATYTNNVNSNPDGGTVSTITVTYEDGTTKNVQSYSKTDGKAQMSLSMKGGDGFYTSTGTPGTDPVFALDEDDTRVNYAFTTNDPLEGKALFETTIKSVTATATELTTTAATPPVTTRTAYNKLAAQSATAPAITSNVTVSLKGENKGGVTITGLPDKFTINPGETVSFDGEYAITGKIATNGVTANNSKVNGTTLKVEITSTNIAKAGGPTTVTIQVPPPADFSYKDGDTVTFKFPVQSIIADEGAELNTDRTSFNNGVITVDEDRIATGGTFAPVSITGKNQSYTFYGDTKDGTVLAVNRRGAATGVQITTSDGNAYTANINRSYAVNGTYYPPISTTVTVYDSLGNSHAVPILVGMQKKDSTNGNTWYAALADTELSDGTTLSMSDVEIQFDLMGKVNTKETQPGQLTLTYKNGANSPQIVSVDFSTLTQYAGGNTIKNTANGNAKGTLQSLSIDSAGVITGVYTNGVIQAEAQIAVAQFNNAAGLTRVGGNYFQVSNNSGKANVKTATDLGVTFSPGQLEMSGTDIANEFSDMIITQRGFQSNSKIITVGDEMLETLINMKR